MRDLVGGLLVAKNAGVTESRHSCRQVELVSDLSVQDIGIGFVFGLGLTCLYFHSLIF
jgi:hypothetical protein